MLDGKKYPDNFRALRIVAEELLRDIINPNNFETTDDLVENLFENLKESTKTSQVWINNFLKPLFKLLIPLSLCCLIMHRYGSWHLQTCSKMIIFDQLPHFRNFYKT